MARSCACVTIGELETAAGIARDHDARFAFWRDFSPLKDKAFDAAVAELHRRIEAKLSTFTLPTKKARK